MIRKIVEIDKEKCNGCGLCVNACHEAAIIMNHGKAELVSDEYCDGLGNCLPECPTGAIKIVEREASEFDEKQVKKRIDTLMSDKLTQDLGHTGCPGSRTAKLKEFNKQKVDKTVFTPPELQQWPVQLNLINPSAGYLKNADLLIAADCTAFAYGGFHNDFMKGKITIIGCPKLDDNEFYKDKLKIIFKNNKPNSITVVRMDVPCCTGIVNSVKEAMLGAQLIVKYDEIVITTDGKRL